MKLVKVFTETRFESSLLFQDLRTITSLLKEVKKKFPIVEFNTEQQLIACFDPQKKLQCFIHSDRVVIDQDVPNDFSYFKSVATHIIPLVMQRFEVEDSLHVGVRAHYINQELITEKESSRNIVQTFMNPKTSSFIKNNMNEVGFQPRVGFVKTINHEFSMNINIAFHQTGSGKVSELGKLENLVIEKVSPLTDIDIFTSVPKKFHQINSIINFCCNEIASYPNIIWKESE